MRNNHIAIPYRSTNTAVVHARGARRSSTRATRARNAVACQLSLDSRLLEG
jgi:hypothetical protein